MNIHYTYKNLPYIDVTVNDQDNTIIGRSANGDSIIADATAQRWVWDVSFAGAREENLMGNLLSSGGDGRDNVSLSFPFSVPQPVHYVRSIKDESTQTYGITPSISVDSTKFLAGANTIQWHYNQNNVDVGVGLFVRLSGSSTIDAGSKIYMITELMNDVKTSELSSFTNKRTAKIYPKVDFDVPYAAFICKPLEVEARVLHGATNNSVTISSGVIQGASYQFLEWRRRI